MTEKTVHLTESDTLVIGDLSGLANLKAVKRALASKAVAAAKLANELAITDPANEGELYYVKTRNGVVGVMPNSYKGVVDDAYHSTFLKVIAQEGVT